VNETTGHLDRDVSTTLAALALEATRLGVIDGWRAYILDQAKRSGISNCQMAAEISKQKVKRNEN
jgi:hypothetical protein